MPGIIQVLKLNNLGNPLRTVNHPTGQNGNNQRSKGSEKAGSCGQHQDEGVAAGGGRVGRIWEWRVGRELKVPKEVTLPGAWPSETLFFSETPKTNIYMLL